MTNPSINCGFTQQVLVGFHEKYFEKESLWGTYFFTNLTDMIPSTSTPSKLPRCMKCGRTIDEHATGQIHADLQTSGAAPVTSLSALDGLVTMSLRNRFLPELFNPKDDKTCVASSKLAKYVRDKFSSQCCVCGSQENVTVAHILKRKEDCLILQLQWDASNFIALCGTEGQRGTCHNLFDKEMMSFAHISGEDGTKWSVVGGGGYHKKQVTLTTCPHKRVLHSHLTRCHLNKSLIFSSDAEAMQTRLSQLSKSDDVASQELVAPPEREPSECRSDQSLERPTTPGTPRS